LLAAGIGALAGIGYTLGIDTEVVVIKVRAAVAAGGGGEGGGAAAVAGY